MGKDMHFLESPATKEENECNYRLEWDDDENEFDRVNMKIIHKGPGSSFYEHDYDSAYEAYCSKKRWGGYLNLRLIRIDKQGKEMKIFPIN